MDIDKDPHAVALGRKGGLAGKGKTSRAKAAAARKNGKKGGRPKGTARKAIKALLAVLCLLFAGCASPISPSITVATDTAVLTIIVDTASTAPLLVTVAADSWLGPPVYASQHTRAFQPMQVSLSVPQTIYVSVEAAEYGGGAGQRIVFDRTQTITLHF